MALQEVTVAAVALFISNPESIHKIPWKVTGDTIVGDNSIALRN